MSKRSVYVDRTVSRAVYDAQLSRPAALSGTKDYLLSQGMMEVGNILVRRFLEHADTPYVVSLRYRWRTGPTKAGYYFTLEVEPATDADARATKEQEQSDDYHQP